MKREFQLDLMEPASTTDENGQAVGMPKAIVRGLWCSIEPLVGREGEVAHQTRGFSVLKVKFTFDPRIEIKSHYYLQDKKRRLEIADIRDLEQNGREYELLCGEAR